MIYDLAVIGGGPAGYSAALEGAGLGLSVILFEKEKLGGTCLNRGCVPTKFFAHAAEMYSNFFNCGGLGIEAVRPVLNFHTAQRRKNEITEKLRCGLEQTMLQSQIVIVSGYAHITDARHILCGGAEYEAENILIATGSVPAPPLAEGALTSDGILKLQYIPKSVKIIGGGVIAVEFAHILSLFGADITVSVRGERLLRGWDREISSAISQNFRKQGITIQTKCTPEQLCEKSAEIILSAAGRLPDLSGINKTLINLDRGAIVVSDKFRTKTPNIYAAGDVISGSPMLAHTAMEQGRTVARLIAGKPARFPSAVVHCIYTSPEAASVGLTEELAKMEGVQIVTAKQTFFSNARTIISGSGRGFIKILADRQSHKIVGAQLMCDRATDIADEFALAVNLGLTVEDLCRAARPHPSYCEAITEAAETLLKKIS